MGGLCVTSLAPRGSAPISSVALNPKWRFFISLILRRFVIGVLSCGLALSVSGTAAAENADIRILEQEIIITADGDVYEVGVDVDSLDQFAEENKPAGVSPMAWCEEYLSSGTLRLQTVSCSHASIDYFKHSGSRIYADFGVAQVGRSTKWENNWRYISAGGRSGHTFTTSGSGNVQGWMNVQNQGEFVTKYISCN